MKMYMSHAHYILGIARDRPPYIGRAIGTRRAHGAVGVLVGVLMGGIPFYRPRIKDHSPCMVFACPPPLMRMPHFTLPFRRAWGLGIIELCEQGVEVRAVHGWQASSTIRGPLGACVTAQN